MFVIAKKKSRTQENHRLDIEVKKRWKISG
jgi:hypothetical protein